MSKRRRPEQVSMLKLMGMAERKQPFHGHMLLSEDDRPQLSVTTIGPDCPEGPTVLDLTDEQFEEFVATEMAARRGE